MVITKVMDSGFSSSTTKQCHLGPHMPRGLNEEGQQCGPSHEVPTICGQDGLGTRAIGN